jgi:hypothetical protein
VRVRTSGSARSDRTDANLPLPARAMHDGVVRRDTVPRAVAELLIAELRAGEIERRAVADGDGGFCYPISENRHEWESSGDAYGETGIALPKPAAEPAVNAFESAAHAGANFAPKAAAIAVAHPGRDPDLDGELLDRDTDDCPP